MKMVPDNQLLPALDCPVDGVKVNENKVRTTAAFVFLVTVTYLLTSTWVLPLFMLVDFGLRAFDYGKYSPLASLSAAVVRGLQLPVVMIDQVPKRFAAGVGLVFAAVILGLQAVGINALIPAGILALFAALEAFAGFCAGCYVYTFLKPLLSSRALK
ncbi:DUF4395 domain-containing protein [Spirosoma koreense]